ncbi:Zn-ribbon-containing protein [Vibrio inusitatus NBRC 102082]|uniref:Zn-ribbon-containing protein n=1 Tax=Vibrio inusitatus NBRC 102082 TaxID=1219070 RepID=A0A4Y3HQI4_9VIBR|nr:Zn-ribbon-containing protein [Vibrio inusitatus]GEA49336.1 Zn-ribbon-containing protein [Vibrio inusitatus NBRC 102082]
MFVCELQFECYDNTTFTAVEKSINGLMEALRFNGQVLGREFPLAIDGATFNLRCVCPEKDSLHPKNHSDFVRFSMVKLSEAGLLAPKLRVLGQDLNSEETCTEDAPSWQILYTTYVHTCSPLRSGDSFMPIPLYRNPPTLNGDHKSIVKWQTEWQACDELQMAGGCKAEHAALRELNSVDSDIYRRGWDLRGRIEYITKIPTYYYLYQVGGESLKQEQQRQCPKCGGEWLLDEPLHDMFHFKCDSCRLLSNISWDHLK